MIWSAAAFGDLTLWDLVECLLAEFGPALAQAVTSGEIDLAQLHFVHATYPPADSALPILHYQEENSLLSTQENNNISERNIWSKIRSFPARWQADFKWISLFQNCPKFHNTDPWNIQNVWAVKNENYEKMHRRRQMCKEGSNSSLNCN